MKKYFKKNIREIILFTLCLTAVSCNVFSPEYEKFDGLTGPGDNATIEGLMRNFVYSYAFKDSFLYEEILDPEFIFEYDDQGTYESWGRDEDIRITKRMFRNFKKIDLVFNTVFPLVTQQPDTTIYSSFRIGFYSGDEVISLTGYSKFTFKKYNDDVGETYKILYWGDLK
jgi:hypothetical protein